MDPTSFTRTNFCGTRVDNITENGAKQYILDQMALKCSGISHKSRYAKVYNENYRENLSNPHVVCLKSLGTPYLLFVTQINETNYSFLIDKKVQEGYVYPKIFIVPFHWSPEMYEGTLLECELIRDRNQKWFLSLGDLYYDRGMPMAQTVVIARINRIHQLVDKYLQDSEFTKVCTPFIKRYFDYKDIPKILSEFVPTLTYDIRGCYFVPMRCSYAKLVLLLPRENPLNPSVAKGSAKPTPRHSQPKGSAKPTPRHAPGSVKPAPKHAPGSVKPAPKHEPGSVKPTQEFRIMKTLKPDVYEVYSEDQGHFKKQGLLLVQTSEISQRLFERCTQSEVVRLPCQFQERFGKWIPIL